MLHEKNSPNCFAYALPKYKYHLNGLNEASQAATRAIHMCLGEKYVSQKSVPTLCMRRHRKVSRVSEYSRI